MVYYGPWTQGADYTRPTSYLYQVVNVPTGTAERTYPGAVAPYDDELNDILDSTTATTTAQGNGPGGKLEVESVGPVPNTSPLEIKFGTRISQGGAEWDATQLLDLAYYQPLVEASKPPTAYGVEFESTTITPVAANLHLEIGADAEDTTLPVGSTQSMVSASLFMTIRGGSSYASAGAQLALVSILPGMMPAVFDFDMSGLMGPQGEVGVSTSVAKSSPWAYYDQARYGLIRVNSTLPAVEMVYTLHPPRHRWLYDAPPRRHLPPLRLNQRGNDGAGITGGRRIVQARSMQATNRRGVGFY